MMVLISGKNDSGKSICAEQLVAQIDAPRYYIATMVAENEENLRRIEKHRHQRANLGFRTIEEPWKIGTAPVSADSVVLLEDASNLLANGIFSYGGTKEQALEEILQLEKRCMTLFVVTISGLSTAGYEGETAAYIRNLQWLNEKLLDHASEAIQMRNGNAFRMK